MGDCSCGIPEGAVVLNVLHIVEYLDPKDGDLYKLDLSTGGDGDDLPISKYLELCEWGRMIAVAPIVADMVRDYVFGDDDDGNEEETAEI